MLTGFSTVWIVIFVGWLMARWGLLDPGVQRALADVSFHLGTPALLFLLLARADLKQAFAPHLAVSFAAMCIALAGYLAAELLWFRRGAGDAVIGGFLSCYTNAANLGLPVAAYVLGDMAWMAPILLMQVGLVQPIGLTILDMLRARRRGERSTGWQNASLPFRNPMTVGALLGLVANLVHLPLPRPVVMPLELIGQLAVPTMLVAFGISLASGDRVGRGEHRTQMWFVTVVKLVGMPAVAFALAHAANLDPHTTLAVTVVAGLPSAQNIFVHAVRYSQSIPLARDTIFVDTLLSIPTLIGLSLLLSA